MSAKQSSQDLRSERTWRALGEVAEHPIVAAWRDKARKTTAPHPRFAVPVWAAAAAVLAIAVGLYFVLGYRNSSGESELRTAATALGEMQRLVLSDGSKVALNTASRVDVHYSGAVREIRLVKGEALFTVAKDSRRPFIVTAAGRQVLALGTAFGVRLDGTAVKVTLLEGRVEVKEADVQRRGIELKPGQQLVAEAEKAAVVRNADVRRATSWQDGWIILNGDTVRTAIDEVNRYTRERITCDDLRIATLRVSGTFRTGEIKDFIDALTKLHPLIVDRAQPEEISLKWRE
jgi:transmembrane sensor